MHWGNQLSSITTGNRTGFAASLLARLIVDCRRPGFISELDGTILLATPALLDLCSPGKTDVLGKKVQELGILESGTPWPGNGGDSTAAWPVVLAGCRGEEFQLHRVAENGNHYICGILVERRQETDIGDLDLSRNDLFRTIGMSALDALIMIDPAGTVTFWNPAAERIFGYSSKDVIGNDMHDLIAPQRYHAQMRPAFAAFATSGKGNIIGQVVEVEAQRKDGTEFPVEISISAVQLNGRWHAVGVVRDISQRKQQEEALQAAAREREQFYRFLVHDLNKPLASMIGLANRIDNKAVLAEVKQMAGMIRNAANRSQELVGQLLAFEKIRRGEVRPHLKPISLRGAVIGCARLLSERHENIKVSIDGLLLESTDEAQPAMTMTDPVHLGRILQNLIDNGLKYSRSEIRMSVSEADDEARFSIWSDGPAIPVDEREAIFREFYRSASGGTGFGLGLSSARQLAELLGGHLWLECPPKGGNEFFLSLPSMHQNDETPARKHE